MKIRPKVDQTFPANQPHGSVLQVYNLKVDEKRTRTTLTLDMQVLAGDKQLAHTVQTSEQLKQTGEQITLQSTLPLTALAPGKYRVEIKASDALSNQMIDTLRGVHRHAPGNDTAARTASAQAHP